jgi:hypothetical protein
MSEPAFNARLEALAPQLAVSIDVAAVLARIGPFINVSSQFVTSVASIRQ